MQRVQSYIPSVRDLAARTVHVKMYPTARTFRERREVLRVMERFGEVTMFQSLKYHPRTPVQNAFLLLFASETSARTSIDQSPIRYRLITEPSQSATPSEGPPSSSPTALEEKPSPEATEQVFELHMSQSQFDHERYIKEQTLHGPWKPVQGSYSYMASSLERTVPDSVSKVGLCDWDTDALKWRTKLGERSEEMQPRTKNWAEKPQPGPWGRVAARIKRRKQSDIPEIMNGLRGLMAEDGLSKGGKDSGE